MKKIILALTVAMVVVVACSKKNSTPDTSINKPKSENNFSQFAVTGIDTPFIPIDTANVMLTSYQASTSATDVKSFIVDAEALRYYLSNTNIKRVKIMLAHKLSWVRSGNAGQPAGYNPNGLTIIISGIDKDNNYIYTPQGAVMDHAVPCPYMCGDGGNASSHLLPQAQ